LQVSCDSCLHGFIDPCIQAYPDGLIAGQLGIRPGDDLQVQQLERFDQVSHLWDAQSLFRAKLDICAAQKVDTDIQPLEYQ
jgi:hypothetical protein